MGDALTCSICHRKKTTRFYGSECCGCYAYRLRHGVDWSPPRCQACGVAIGKFARISKQFCKECGEIAAKASYAESYKRLRNQEKRCLNCSSPYRSSYSRLCGRCYLYQWKHGGDPRPITKSCVNCGRDFPFTKTKVVCSVSCRVEWSRLNRTFYLSDPVNRNRNDKAKRDWALRNPDKVVAGRKKTKKKHAERIAVWNREWIKRNPDKRRRYKATSQARNRQAYLETKRRHYAKYRERYAEYNRKHLDKKDPTRPLMRAIRVGNLLVGKDRITP